MLGYGFVHMTEQTGAERAIAAINDTIFNGKKLTVRVADKNAKEPATSSNHRQAASYQYQNNQAPQRNPHPGKIRDQHNPFQSK
jgi:RNA recognition motif-containing protein